MNVDTGVILGLAEQVSALAEQVDALAARVEHATEYEQMIARARASTSRPPRPAPRRSQPRHLLVIGGRQ